VGGIDEENLVAWARMGDRMRMTSTAEFTGYDTSYKPSDFDNMLRVARDLYPEGADYGNPARHACLRPMTPDGPPIFGRGKHANLYFNTGQGHMGWTMAAGSGKVIADVIAGRKPEIDIAGMTLDRF
jgi:D-amino-acid dehydrogenase